MSTSNRRILGSREICFSDHSSILLDMHTFVGTEPSINVHCSSLSCTLWQISRYERVPAGFESNNLQKVWSMRAILKLNVDAGGTCPSDLPKLIASSNLVPLGKTSECEQIRSEPWKEPKHTRENTLVHCEFSSNVWDHVPDAALLKVSNPSCIPPSSDSIDWIWCTIPAVPYWVSCES